MLTYQVLDYVHVPGVRRQMQWLALARGRLNEGVQVLIH